MWTRTGLNTQNIKVMNVVKAAELDEYDWEGYATYGNNPGNMPMMTATDNSTWVDSVGGDDGYWTQTVTLRSECKNMVDDSSPPVKDPSAFATSAATYADRFYFDWTYEECTDWNPATSTCASVPLTLPVVTSRIWFDPTIDPDTVDEDDTRIDATSTLTLYTDSVVDENLFDNSLEGDKYREGEKVCVKHKLDHPYDNSFAFAAESMQACRLIPSDIPGSNYEFLLNGTTDAVRLGCDKAKWDLYINGDDDNVGNGGVNPIDQWFNMVTGGVATSEIGMGIDVEMGVVADDDAHFEMCFNLVADVFTRQFADSDIAITSTGTVSYKNTPISFSAISTRAATDPKNSQTAAFVVAAREDDQTPPPGPVTESNKVGKSEAWKLGLTGTILSACSLLSMLSVLVYLRINPKAQQARLRQLRQPRGYSPVV
jgi:hypothetical protein